MCVKEKCVSLCVCECGRVFARVTGERLRQKIGRHKRRIFFRDDELQSIQNPDLEKFSVKIFVRREEEDKSEKMKQR